MTSHLLSKFDVDFGDKQSFIQFEHNPIFFELRWVNAYNNKLIQSLGYKYTDFFLPVEADFEQAQTQAIEQEIQGFIEQEWPDSTQIGIKDPRFSLTLPVWAKLLQVNGYQVNVIVVFRCPAGFLASNKKLFHNWEGWTDRRHLNFWSQLNLAAIYLSRHLPMYSVSYDRLMQHPLQEAEKLANYFQLDRDRLAEAASVIQPAFHHHQAFVKTGNSLVDQCYQSLCADTLLPTDYLNYRNSMLLGQADLTHLDR